MAPVFNYKSPVRRLRISGFVSFGWAARSLNGRFIKGWSNYHHSWCAGRSEGIPHHRSGAFPGSGICTSGCWQRDEEAGDPECEIL